VDVIEEVIAEGDQVGMLFAVHGTQRGNLFGIPPTGKKVDVHEIAILRIADGKMVEGWFMADEAALLKQLGARMPERSDGKLVVPPVTHTGEDPGRRREAPRGGAAGDARGPPASHRCALQGSGAAQGAARARLSAAAQRLSRICASTASRAGRARCHGDGCVSRPARPHRRVHRGEEQRVDALQGRGHPDGQPVRHPPTGKVVEVAEIGTARFVDGKWAESWYFGDELGMILQLGLSPNILLG
jgi:predicted ester cyclase